MAQSKQKNKGSGGTVVQIPTQKEVAGKTRKEKCISCGKQFLTFLFSTIGLSMLMVAYTIFGAFIFMKLEAPAEETLNHNIQQRRKWYVDYLWNRTYEMNVFFKENWTRVTDNMLKNYTDEVYKISEKGWNGKQNVDIQENHQWSFPASMLYSITVITTIGRSLRIAIMVLQKSQCARKPDDQLGYAHGERQVWEIMENINKMVGV